MTCERLDSDALVLCIFVDRKECVSTMCVHCRVVPIGGLTERMDLGESAIHCVLEPCDVQNLVILLLTDCSPVTHYKLSQYWIRYWFVAWRHQALAWSTIFDIGKWYWSLYVSLHMGSELTLYPSRDAAEINQWISSLHFERCSWNFKCMIIKLINGLIS